MPRKCRAISRHHNIGGSASHVRTHNSHVGRRVLNWLFFSQVDDAALPALTALLERLVGTNRATEELARRVLPAVRAVLERYVRHVLPREKSAAQSKAATRGHRKSENGGGRNGAGPLDSRVHASRRSGSVSPPRNAPPPRQLETRKMTSDDYLPNLPLMGRDAREPGSGAGDGADLEKEVALLIERIGMKNNRQIILNILRC